MAHEKWASGADLLDLSLRQDEYEYLMASERCQACQHLIALHQVAQGEHYCPVGGCGCVEWTIR